MPLSQSKPDTVIHIPTPNTPQKRPGPTDSSESSIDNILVHLNMTAASIVHRHYTSLHCRFSICTIGTEHLHIRYVMSKPFVLFCKVSFPRVPNYDIKGLLKCKCTDNSEVSSSHAYSS